MKAGDTMATWDRPSIDMQRKRKIITCVLLAGLLTFLFTKPSKVQWEAVSKVRVARAAKPPSFWQELLMINEANNIETHRISITGQQTLIRVAYRLKLLPDEYLSEDVEDIIRERFNEARVGDLVKDLRDRIEVRREGGTGMLAIHVRALKAKEAQDLADAVAEEYKDQTNKENNRNLDRVRKFVEDEFLKAQGQVRERQQAAQRLRTAALGLGVQDSLPLASQRDALAQRRQLVAGQIQQLKQIQSSKDESNVVAVLLGGHDDTPIIQRFSDQLAERQVEMCELLGHTSPDSPEVKELRGRIKGLVNGALRSLAQIQSRLEQQSFRINEVLKTSPQVEMDLARAESGVEAARITLAKLSSVKQDLDIKQQERVATVWVEEHASGARMIKKPGKFLKVVVGCLVGIFLGLVWSSRTVERKLGELIRREWGAEPCDASEPLAFGEPPANDPPSDDGAGEQT